MGSGQYIEFEFKDHEREPIPIVSDGIIANPETQGVPVAAIVVETSGRSDVEDVVQGHTTGASGEVESAWGSLEPDNPEELSLILTFSGLTPDPVKVILRFDIDAQGALVDQIMQKESLMFLPGREGDRPSKFAVEGRPGILVEVPAIRDDWQLMWTDVICRKLNCSPDLARKMQEEMRRVFGGSWLPEEEKA